ncbi:carbohydrate-binding family 9-like protein [Dyadobacter chenwenxiniae]|uniref:Carbohydrate-binding family 9-like protein n=1 Tax=Dyadobacter chenwenxiniae TaxID=2906456 RepID=A0A9X1TKA1_9BACT|nr:carbohydrate-binding family 9-like protein [Dyadobacter chenwenxiniae]MCF0061018.1 carbohydrate-binding family 9-like protein [Dyadobacter chenwenxiniae]UON80846.1 carbohydrate-binding family 9-like protein [Dyadobacter chenwenxiniae]
MKINFLNLTSLLLFANLVTLTTGFGQTDSPKKYISPKTAGPIKIDGNLDERSWKKAPWTAQFVDIEGNKKPLPYQHTKAKMLWDDAYLYIAAVIEEEHIWAYQEKKDQIVYLENDFEVFIDPDGDGENYYELEVNAINNTFDLFLPKTYKKGGRAQLKWDIKDLKSAVSIEGTVNNAKDTDKRWTLEIAIPFASLTNEHVPAIIPANGSEWRINFSRVNWQHEVSEDGKYTRKRNVDTGKVLPEYNWVWSPQGIINMHYPEYWGYLQFVDPKEKKNK